MEVEVPDSLEVQCAKGELVNVWAFTIKNVGKASWPENTCLCLEESKESMVIIVGAVRPGKTFTVSGRDNGI